MKEKLEYLLRTEKLTATSLARLLEIQPSGLSHILSGRNKPSFDLVVKILRAFPKINPDWLLLGSDKIYRDDVVASEDDETPPTLADFNNGELFDTEQNIESSAVEIGEKNELPANFSNIQKSASGTKHIERVIVLYSDNSFDSYSAR